MATPTAPGASPAESRPLARVLIADDDEAMRGLARRILERGGYGVVTVSDGAAALGATHAAMAQPGSAIHLVLTDIDMPGCDGYALGRQLMVRWPVLPVIYMSGTTHGLARRARLVPSEHFLEKPFSAERLLLTIGLVLQRRALGPWTMIQEA